MIGAFARMLGAKERLLAVEETENRGYATMAAGPQGVEAREGARDAPPEAFVERVSDEGGDVYLSPMIEALRSWVRRQRGLPEADADANLPRVSDNGE